MSNSFTTDSSYIIARVDSFANGIYGTGRAELPILVVQLRFTFSSPSDLHCTLDFRELRCRISSFDQVYVAHSVPAHIDLRLPPGKSVSEHAVIVEVPFDQTRLALLNRLRNGGDVKLRLDFELFVDELHQLGPKPNSTHHFVYGITARHRCRADLQVSIPRSEWVERVLPGTGFAQTHIIELPAIPLQACAGKQAAFVALQQAQKLEGQGFYEEAVMHCRIALEPFIELVDKTDDQANVKKVPKLKASWETRLGSHTYEWLDGALRSVKGATNHAAHNSPVVFGQLEAQMLLMITTALIAYAVKTQPGNPE